MALWAEPIGRALALPGEAGAGEIRADRRIFTVSSLAIRGEDEEAAVLVLEEVTERRRLQERLIQSEKMSAIGQLIAGVAHELNNPLASVLGFADFLIESGESPEHLAEPLKVIQQEANRAASIVKSLLTLTRRRPSLRQAGRARALDLPGYREGARRPHHPEVVRRRRRVVFSTGDTVRDDTLAFLQKTGRPCLHKPFKLAELRSTLQAALEAGAGDSVLAPWRLAP